MAEVDEWGGEGVEQRGGEGENRKRMIMLIATICLKTCQL